MPSQSSNKKECVMVVGKTPEGSTSFMMKEIKRKYTEQGFRLELMDTKEKDGNNIKELETNLIDAFFEFYLLAIKSGKIVPKELFPSQLQEIIL